MSTVEVRKVKTSRELHDFIHIVDRIYGHCPQYVPDMESDIRALFDVKKNAGLEFSDIMPFIAYSGQQVVGRIIGIVNHKANKRWQTHNVRFSMIEFIDDPAVSKALLQAVADWGRSLGMDALQGPMGITDFDKEGMLVESFQLEGSMNTIYNPDYYPRHMEALGMEKEVDWVQIRIQIPHEVPARYARTAQYVREQMGLRVVKLKHSQFHEYGMKLFHLLNEAYKPIFGFSEMSEQQAEEFLKKYSMLLDLQLIPIILNQNNEVVGAAITIGSLTKAMQKAKGRLWPMGWYHLLKALKWKHEDHAEMLLVAVRPDYQGMGVNALFFEDLIPVYQQYGFQWAETGPQLEYNMRELTQWKPLHPEIVKRRRCYHKAI
jgi:ribosomal protein S18 acetylase RimI-like enzyme